MNGFLKLQHRKCSKKRVKRNLYLKWMGLHFLKRGDSLLALRNCERERPKGNQDGDWRFKLMM
jgi:hypothetical protein